MASRVTRRVIRLSRPGLRTNDDGAEGARVSRQKVEGADKASESKSEEVPEEEEEEERQRRHERWAEEYFDVVEQLPLELHRTFTLMRELETKMQDRITFVASHTRSYRDARLAHRLQTGTPAIATTPAAVEEAFVQPDYGTSSDMDAEGEEYEEEQVQFGTSPRKDTPPSSSLGASRAARLSLLGGIARASTEAIRAAEEKVGLAMTAYDWIDRHIRRLDADLQRSESSLLLGLRAGTEASRGVRDALGIGEGETLYGRSNANQGWEDDSVMSGQSTPLPTTATAARAADAALSASLVTDMAIDPNEPKYCYCDQVSSGDMVACDNEDCPREWFHYHCVGLAAPPKGRWYCLFCAPPGYKGSGTFPPNAPCLPPGYDSRRPHNGEERSTAQRGGRGGLKRKKR